jgi:hypothetical protein
VTDCKLLSLGQTTRRLGIGPLELRRLIRNDQEAAKVPGQLRSGSFLPAGPSVHSIIVRAVNRDYAENRQYHVLPTDDPLRALNILREAAGLPPFSDEPSRPPLPS